MSEVDSNEIDDKQYQEFFDKGGEVEDATETETKDDPEENSDDSVAAVDETSEDSGEESDDSEEESPNESADDEPVKQVDKDKQKNYDRAYEAERAKRKQETAKYQESQRQYNELRQKNEALQKTLERIIEKANETPKPKFEDDPIGALQNELQETKKETHALKQNVELSAKEKQEAENFQKFVSAYTEQVDEFAATTPDYDDAYQHLLKSRYQEHLVAGLSKDEAKEEVRMEEARIAHKAMMDGVNPGERIYQLAKIRNYQPKAEVIPAKTAAEQSKAGGERIEGNQSYSSRWRTHGG